MGNAFELVRNAKVHVDHMADEHTGDPRLRVLINDRHQHLFAASDKESKYLEYAPPQDIQTRLDGGTFFFVGDKLVDYRRRDYKGFVHTEDSIEALIENIGLETPAIRRSRGFSAPAPHPVFARQRNRGLSKDIQMGGSHSDFKLTVPEYGAGGEFTAKLVFRWNPFSELVNSVVEVLRLICSNGMVGISPLINAQIPIINNHKEHMDIAASQIEHRFTQMMLVRLREMGEHRASVHLLQFIRDEAIYRMMRGAKHDDITRLATIAQTADPVRHLRGFYAEKDFENRSKAKLLDGHLTEFDAFNLMTELDSHTVDHKEQAKDSRSRHDSAVQVNLNTLVFDARLKKKDQYHVALSNAPLSELSNPERAFFAAVQAA